MNRDVVGLISSVLPTPTFTVDTGHGIDAFWVFETPCKIGDNISLEKAKSIVSGWGKHLADIFNFSGWKIDNVYDLSRMLRAPGSINHKLSDGAECKIITDTNIDYRIEDFEPYRIDQTSSEYSSFDADERTIGSAERIMQKCLFVQKMINDANGVTEPEWKALCSNISLTPDGHDKFHEWSSLYNGYSHDETERKIIYSARANKPCTCRYIHENLGFACPIGGCGVKAPIVFAQYSKEEQIKNMLNDNNLKAEDMLNDYELNLSVYTGNMMLQKYYSKDHLSKRTLKNNGVLPKYYAEDTHPAIISQSDFDKAQMLFAERTKDTDFKRYDYDFKSMVLCGCCGWRYRRKKNYKKYVWRYGNSCNNGKDACLAKQIAEDILYALATEINGDIERVTILPNNEVCFVLSDETEILKHWVQPSRAESWTDEMKLEASKTSKERSRNHADRNKN